MSLGKHAVAVGVLAVDVVYNRMVGGKTKGISKCFVDRPDVLIYVW